MRELMSHKTGKNKMKSVTAGSLHMILLGRYVKEDKTDKT
jgi:hypothetical protein